MAIIGIVKHTNGSIHPFCHVFKAWCLINWAQGQLYFKCPDFITRDIVNNNADSIDSSYVYGSG
jgi:hypothetical protein